MEGTGENIPHKNIWLRPCVETAEHIMRRVSFLWHCADAVFLYICCRETTRRFTLLTSWRHSNLTNRSR